MSLNKAIRDIFYDMIVRFSRTVRKGINPHRYHNGAPVKEASSIHFFCEAVEKHLNALSFLEFSNDATRIDALLVTPKALFLVEAKGTLMKHDSANKLAQLERQSAVFEQSSHSLAKYLRTAIIDQFQNNKDWEDFYRFEEIWGILLSDTFHDELRLKWDSIPAHKYPFLSTYTRESKLNAMYSDDKENWWHLIAYKPLDLTLFSKHDSMT